MRAENIPASVTLTNANRYPFEWPTWVVIVAVYSGWVALTFGFKVLPWWVVLPAGAWFTAWHMSLQHEIIHGHPTKIAWVDRALGFPPLSLWLPSARYRQLHLAHHRDEWLTDPVEDPESFYVRPDFWRARGPLGRALTRFFNTALGRILFNPAVAIPRFLMRDARALISGDRNLRRIWLIHGLGVAVILFWIIGICRISLWEYLVCFVYPGYALASLRSFAEHRAAALPEHRTAIVEKTPLFGLLFLHNNLHVVHHDHPSVPWYGIPAYYRAHRSALIRQNGGLVYRGYRDVIGRYWVRAHDAPVHPRFEAHQ